MSYPTTPTGTYTIDPAHSRIGFVTRQSMVTKVRGSFNDLAGTGYFDADDPTRSHLELTIHTQSIDTGNARRDAHLRSNSYFAVDAYSEIRFVSTAVQRIDHRNHHVTGDLTIKGVTKPVVINVGLTVADDPFGDQRLDVQGKTVIYRKDWGITWNAVLEGGGVLVGNKVPVEFKVSAIRTATEQVVDPESTFDESHQPD